MFAKGARLKLRFESGKGLISIEDLYDLGQEKLNLLWKFYNKLVKAEGEDEGLMVKKTTTEVLNTLRRDIIASIFKEKAEAAALKLNSKKTREDKAAKKAKLLARLDAIEGEEMGAKTKEETLAELAELDN